MAVTLGEKLREAREARGYSLREVADQTRISVRYLESIENDDYSTLPGGVFNKGFVKTFARSVGINEKEALDDYARLMGQQGTVAQDEDAPISRRSEVYIGEEPRSPILTIIVSLVMLGLLVWGVIAGLQWYQNRNSQPIAGNLPAANNNSNTAVALTPTPAPTETVTNVLNVQIKANKQDVYIATTADGNKQEFTLRPGETRDFTAQNEFKVNYAKARANQLQMTVNGKPVKIQTESPRGSTIEMTLTRDNYAQFLQ